MRKRNMRGYVAGLALVAGLCMTQGISAHAATEAQSDSGTGQSYETADPSRGVTYIKNDSGSTMGINLNGNSAVIRMSENSTSDKVCINIYNDKNRNGKVDAGETAFKLDGSADIIYSSGMPIYGLYQQKYDKPMAITLDGADLGVVKGVSESVLTTTGSEAALTIRIKNKTQVGAVTGADASEVKGDVDFIVDDSTILGAVYGGNSETTVINGSVDMDINKSTVKGAAYGAYYTEVSGNLDLDVTASTAANVFVAQNAYVAGTLNATVDSSSSVDYFYGVVTATVDGDATVNFANSGNRMSSISYVVNGMYTGKEYSVGGNAVLKLNGGYIGTVTTAANVTIMKNLTVNMQDIKYSGSTSVAGYQSTIKGDVTFDADGINAEGGGGITVVSSAELVDGNVHAALKNYTGNGLSFCGISSGTVNGDFDIQMTKSEGSFYSVSGLQDGVIQGKVNIQITDCTCTSSMFGISGGKLVRDKRSGDDYDVTVVMKNCTAYSICGGVYASSIINSLDLTMDNITVTSGSVYGFYAGSTNTFKGAKINMNRCSGQYIYGYYGNTSTDRGCINPIDVAVTNSRVKYSFYGFYGGYFAEDITLTTSNNISQEYYATYQVQTEKNVTVKTSYENDSAIVDENGNSVLDSYPNAGESNYYIAYYGTIKGTLTAEADHVHFLTFKGNYQTTNAGDVSVTIKNSSFKGNTYNNSIEFANSTYQNADKPVKIDVLAENTDFSSIPSLQMEASLGGNQTAVIRIADTCKMPETYSIIPNRNNKGSATFYVGKDVYYGGIVTLDQDVQAENVYFGNYGSRFNSPAEILVSKGITVTAEKSIYIPVSSKVLNKGTLIGTVQSIDGNRGSLYVSGGTVSGDATDVNIYYPVTLSYNEKAGVASLGNNCMTITQDPGVNYGKTGDVIGVNFVANKGYKLVSAIWKKASESIGSELANTSTGYSFDMPAEPVDVQITFDSIPIELKKTKADPCAVLDTEYTEEKPLYDLADVLILNDSTEGTIAYSVDTAYALPEGLKLVNGKIVGTATTAYEDGKRVDILVTGRNGSTATLQLDVIVSQDQKVQDSTSDRLTIDDENKVIILNASSVVLQEVTQEDGASVITGIYADDDQNGIADSATPMYSGDLSNYTIKGITDLEYAKAIHITMLGGAADTIYGAQDATLTYTDGHSVVIDIQGGSVNKVYGLNHTFADGSVMIRDAKGTVTTAAVQLSGSGGTYNGYYYDKAGKITISGDCTIAQKIEGDTLTIASSANVTFKQPVSLTGNVTVNQFAGVNFESDLTAEKISSGYSYANIGLKGKTTLTTFATGNSTVTINENAELITDAVDVQYSAAVIYHKGEVSCKTFTCTGKWLVMGTFAEDTDISEWTGLYFKSSFTSNIDSAKLDTNGCSDYKWLADDEAVYLAGNQEQTIGYTGIPGYKAFVSVNGGERIEGEYSKCTVTTPQGEMAIDVEYRPTQLTCSKRYADPIAVKGTAYTAEDPLYDLTMLQISNDTTEKYGSDKKYQVKEGSALPDGLQLENGLITGTPSDAAETTDVVFTITGRNGGEVDCTVTITVKEAGYKITDLNEDVTVSKNNEIDLKGHSVVVLSDPSDSSKTSIYPDDDHDGVADHGKALKIGGESSYSLSNYAIYGYTDTKNAYEGDISIYMYGGTVNSLYGAKGTGSTNTAKVNGTVSLRISGGMVTSQTAVASYAEIKKAEFKMTGGDLRTRAYGLTYSKAEAVTFEFAEKARMSQQYSSSQEYMYVTDNSTVTGDVDVKVGADTGRYAFVNSSGTFTAKSSFYGVYKTEVSGDVNYNITGNWYTGYRNNLAETSNITGNLNVQMDADSFGTSSNTALVQVLMLGGSVNDIKVEDTTGRSNYTVAARCTVHDIRANRTVSSNIRGTVLYLYQGDSLYKLTGSLYAVDNKNLVVGGTYTFDQDVETSALTILDGSDVTINNGVTVSYTDDGSFGGTITNQGSLVCSAGKTSPTAVNGTLINEGTATWTANGQLSIGSAATVINREDAKLTFGLLSNAGTIINDGELEQQAKSTSLGSGAILTSKKLSLAYAASQYSVIYYKTELSCKDFCFEDNDAGASIDVLPASYKKTSGIEGDDAVYVRGNATVTVTVSGQLLDGFAIDSVTYADGVNKLTKKDETTWTGTSAFEPTVFTVNMTDAPDSPITLGKSEDMVDTAMVGKTTTAAAPLYDLTAIEILDDAEDETETVGYSLAKDAVLPDGLVLEGGKIYGTPTTATDKEQVVKIKIRGKNQTVATFVLTITKVAKGIPVLETPGAVNANMGDTLANVTLPKSKAGTYRWADSSVTIAAEDGEYDAYFIPSDIKNYDWSIAGGSAYEELEDGTVQIKVSIRVKAGKKVPVYDVPADLTGIYGQTLADVVLPESEDGTFEWADSTIVLNEVGDQEFIATYIPKDEVVYARVPDIKITVKVNPAKAEFTYTIDEISVAKGTVLGNVTLPEAEKGTYEWVTDKSLVLTESGSYEVCYKPEDITHYDWTGNAGWSNANHGIIFKVSIRVIKDQTPDPDKPDPKPTPDPDKPKPVDPKPDTPKTIDISKAAVSGIVDKNYTGKAQVQSKLKVSLGGKVLTAGKDYVVSYKNNKNVGKATITIKGQNGYTGTVTRTFKIAIKKGKTYVVKNVKYKVTKVSKKGKGTVTVTGSTYKKTSKKLQTLKLGKTVNIGGISYKITAVNKNAFKGYKYLKSVTIGDNITTIGNSAFEGCKALTTVKIGKGVTKIGSKAFYKDAKLKKITITSKKLKSVGKNAFNGIYKKPVVKLPKSKYTKYVNLLKKAKMPSKVTYKKTK